LRRGTLALPDEDAGEFRELGGSDRLDELAGDAWDDMDAEDRRLLAITLLESVLIGPGRRDRGRSPERSLALLRLAARR
jgi:hypothetical protein